MKAARKVLIFVVWYILSIISIGVAVDKIAERGKHLYNFHPIVNPSILDRFFLDPFSFKCVMMTDGNWEHLSEDAAGLPYYVTGIYPNRIPNYVSYKDNIIKTGYYVVSDCWEWIGCFILLPIIITTAILLIFSLFPCSKHFYEWEHCALVFWWPILPFLGIFVLAIGTPLYIIDKFPNYFD